MLRVYGEAKLAAMPRWFVYIDIDYYPIGVFVEAPNSAEAISIARRDAAGTDDSWAAVAAPAEAMTTASGDDAAWRLDQLGAATTHGL